MEEIEAFLASGWDGITWQRMVSLVVLFLACMVVVKVLMALLGKTVSKLRVEATLQTFIKSLVRALLWLVTVILLLGYVGVPVTSLVALLSVIGLAVSLAIQGTLSNLAGGIMVLVSKPFKVGDYIESESTGGTVAGITLAYTRLITPDRKNVLIPNSEIAGARITNYSTEETRRVELVLPVDNSVPVEQVRRRVIDLIQAHPKTLFTPAPEVRVRTLREGAVEYVVRTWCANNDFWEVYFELMEQVHDSFRQEGFTITAGRTRVEVVNPHAPQ